MKKISLLFVSVLIFITGTLSAQNLISSLGGIQTHYIFYSDTIALHVSEQYIIKRAGSYTYGNLKYGDVPAVGYDSYHLEFVTTKALQSQKTYKHNTTSDFIVKFYNADNNLLATKTFQQNRGLALRVTNENKKGSPVFYSLDLFKLPLVILEKTVKINVLEIRK